MSAHDRDRTGSTTAEDVALLLHDPITGKPLLDSTALPRVLAGAGVLDLVLSGHAVIEGTGRKARLTVTSPPMDPVLAEASAPLMGAVAPRRAVQKLARSFPRVVMEHLVARGTLRAAHRTTLGVTIARRWPAVDAAPRRALTTRMADVLVSGVEPTRHDAALVSLLHAARAERRVVHGRRADLKRRAKEIADGDWAGAAVRQAITEVQAAMVAVVAGASGAAGT